MKSIIQNILNEELSGKQYDPDLTPLWSRAIADKIKHKIKGWFSFHGFNVEIILLITLIICKV